MPRSRAAVAIAGWLLAMAAGVLMAVLSPTVRADARVDLGEVTVAEVANGSIGLVLATFGLLVVLRGRDRRYGWLLLAAGVALSVMAAAEEVALHGWYVADEPTAITDLAIWIQGHWAVFFFAVSLALPSLFPDGRPAPGWGRWVRALGAVWVALIVAAAFADVAAESAFLDLPDPPMNPYGFVPVPIDVLNMGWVVLTLASFVVSFLSLRTRWRHAGQVERQQLKWMLLALGFTVWLLAIAMVNVILEEAFGLDTGLGWIESILPLSFSVVAAALGLGVLRFRLYDVDLVINRTVVYGAMSVVVVAAYAAVVGAASGLMSLDDTAASVVATGLIAVAFAPVRELIQRVVNHWLFGRRDDPVGVLHELGRQLEEAGGPEDTLRSVAQMVVASMKVPGARIELAAGGADALDAQAGDVGTSADMFHAIELRHQGTVVGRLVVARRRRNEPLHPADLTLLDGLAHHAAVLAHAVSLHVDLQRSRQQLVTAREEERRRLRRDLHDGLGPSLASHTFRIDAIRRQLASGAEIDQADASLVELKVQTQELVADIRRLVHDLRPPSLDDVGLFRALDAQAAQVSAGGALEVTVDATPDPLGPLPAAVELAAFRIAGEALTNTMRHARARRASIRVRRQPDALIVEVEDDGSGIAADAEPGIGLGSMRERAAELGGRVAVTTNSAGTAVRAVLPLNSSHGVSSDAATRMPEAVAGRG